MTLSFQENMHTHCQRRQDDWAGVRTEIIEFLYTSCAIKASFSDIAKVTLSFCLRDIQLNKI